MKVKPREGMILRCEDCEDYDEKEDLCNNEQCPIVREHNMEKIQAKEIARPNTTELVKLSGDAVMFGDGNGCQVYKGAVNLYVYLINSDKWFLITHVETHGKPKGSKKDSRNPF